eukprot:12217217-Alexandrium_andersonii.AAC.1
MSASLVGSEMCIRDRCCPGELVSEGAALELNKRRRRRAGCGRGGLRGSGQAVAGAPKPTSCLLYTSPSPRD